MRRPGSPAAACSSQLESESQTQREDQIVRREAVGSDVVGELRLYAQSADAQGETDGAVQREVRVVVREVDVEALVVERVVLPLHAGAQPDVRLDERDRRPEH